MKKTFLKGMAFCLGFVGTAIFAVTVSGTIKTWNTGDQLTASDLNTTVQSLKTAVESASQIFNVAIPGDITGNPTYTPAFVSIKTSNEFGMKAGRAGTIKNARLSIITSAHPSACNITLRKNGADTDIKFTVAAGNTTEIVDADTVDVLTTDNMIVARIIFHHS